MNTDVIEGEFKPLAVQSTAAIAAPQLLDALRPAERVALMAEISTVVADVIKKQGWFVDIHGKKHITIHGWTFVGSLAGCSVKTTGYEKIDGGYKAHASVVRVDSGVEVGSAEQVCMKAESFGRGKEDYALIGMASTRACSRALSTTFRHVVELAGYSATPAEEMHKDDKPLGAVKPDHAYDPKPVRVSTEDLTALATSLGLNLGEWLATHVAPDLMDRPRKVLTIAESVKAKAMLEALIPRDLRSADNPVVLAADIAPNPDADARKRRALRTSIHVNAKVLWPRKQECDANRHLAERLHRVSGLADDVIDKVPMEALESLERDLARRANGTSQEQDADAATAALAAYARERLL